MGYHQLAEHERYQIQQWRKDGCSMRETARRLGRSASTISRELRRNLSARGYRHGHAHRLAQARRAHRKRSRKLTPELIGRIEHLLCAGLSPEQVVNYLHRAGHTKLCHETVYRFIAADKAAGGELYKQLRIARRRYRRRYASYQRHSVIPDRVGISERPRVVDARSRIGDWEADTVIGGRRKSAILTLVERKTLFTIIAKLNGKHAAQLAQQMGQALSPHRERVKTITVDNGREFAHHASVSHEINASVYFADPQAAWQKGTIENINGLIRQYFPKGTDFNAVSQEQLDQVAQTLNRRPRKTRGWRSPNELFLGRTDDLLETYRCT